MHYSYRAAEGNSIPCQPGSSGGSAKLLWGKGKGESPDCTSENAVVRKDSMGRITPTEQLRKKIAFLVNQGVLMAPFFSFLANNRWRYGLQTLFKDFNIAFSPAQGHFYHYY